MSDEDMDLIHRIRSSFEKKKSINCTGCRYCMPCLRNVNIPEIFKLYNSVSISNSFMDGWTYQSSIVSAGAGAEQCVNCGACMRHCPQGLKIPENLKRAHERLTR